MTPFQYTRAASAADAMAGTALRVGVPVAHQPRILAGGTNLIDLMKEDVLRPPTLVAIDDLGWDGIAEADDGGLRLGATAHNADTAYHPLVASRYPLLTAAILAGASPQIRNMATNAGNLMQRTRCVYFYDTATPCNKRSPGAGCSAIGGLTRQHAILGASDHCIATHPSDLCVGLAALGATVHVQSLDGTRTIPFADFHRLPGDRPDIDHTLAQGELVTHLSLPPLDALAAHSAYLKVRDRTSYAFALVSAGAALALDDGGRITEVRLALGGVAHKPWRDEQAEALMVGQPAVDATFAAAADALLASAQGQGGNDFKIPLARRAIVRVLRTATAGTPKPAGGVR